jgi:hypothetical protein
MAWTTIIPTFIPAFTPTFAWFTGGAILRRTRLAHRAILAWCFCRGRGIAAIERRYGCQWVVDAAGWSTFHHTFGAATAFWDNPSLL